MSTCQADRCSARTAEDSRAIICARCEDRLNHWLTTIPELYALLPTFIEHGTAERNPDSKATKNPYPPAPMRLDVVDLLDTRLGRKWAGTAPAHDRRGVVGTLRVHVETLIEERPLTATTWNDASVYDCCKLLSRHRLWIAEQEWGPFLYDEVRSIHRQLSDAVGDYRRPPVGHCHIVPHEAEDPCGGGLFANSFGGVRCSRCKASWDATHLRQLGLAQAQAQQEVAQ